MTHLLTKSEVNQIKANWKPGSRIRLLKMYDPHPVEPGTTGTIQYVDDQGTIHVNWDNGRTLGVVIAPLDTSVPVDQIELIHDH